MSKKKENIIMQTGAGVKDYTSKARISHRDDAMLLAVSYRELRRVLRPHLGWRRSHIVAWNLRYAAEHSKQASAHCTAAYISFLKHFQPQVFGRPDRSAGGGRTRSSSSSSNFFGS